MMIFGILATFSLAAAMNMKILATFPPAAAEAFAAAAASPRIRKHNGMATFSSCCCYEFWLLAAAMNMKFGYLFLLLVPG